MTGTDRLDQALDRAIDALRAGADVDGALRRASGQAQLLRPLVEVADLLREEALPPPYPSRLDDHWTIVRAAIERAQMGRQGRREDAQPGGWRRWRMALGSMPAPVAALTLLAAAGVSGAAASVLTTDTGAGIADAVTPGWMDWAVPNGTNAPDAPASDVPTSGPVPAAARDTAPHQEPDLPPGFANQPTEAEIRGAVRDYNGNSFVLVAGDTEWHVIIDANTQVAGTLGNGATAVVSGFVTAERNVQAASVTVTGAAPAAADDAGAPGPPADAPPSNLPPSTGIDVPSVPPGGGSGAAPDPTPTSTPDTSDDGGDDDGDDDKDPPGGGQNNRPPRPPTSGNDDD